jgi:hypothetical protein
MEKVRQRPACRHKNNHSIASPAMRMSTRRHENRLEPIRGISLEVSQVRTPELPDAGLRSTVMRIEYTEAHHVETLQVVERAQEGHSMGTLAIF